MTFKASEAILVWTKIWSWKNPEKIFEYVSDFLDNPEKINSQIKKTQLIINNLKTKKLSSTQVAISLNNFLNKW